MSEVTARRLALVEARIRLLETPPPGRRGVVDDERLAELRAERSDLLAEQGEQVALPLRSDID